VDKKVNDDDVAVAAADDDVGFNCIYCHDGHLTLWLYQVRALAYGLALATYGLSFTIGSSTLLVMMMMMMMIVMMMMMLIESITVNVM